MCSTHDGGVASTDGTSMIDAAIDTPNDGPPPMPIQRTYMASVAECIAPATPSPQLCRSLNGNAQLVIDIRDSTTNEPWHAFIRFEVDAALVGKTITKVVLRLVATNAGNAPGPDSGSVFQVQVNYFNLDGNVPPRLIVDAQ